MENSRIAGARRRLVIAKRFTTAAAALAFGVTFVAIRTGAASNTARTTANMSTTAANQVTRAAPTTTTAQSSQSFFGNSSVGSPSGAAPSVSSSAS